MFLIKPEHDTETYVKHAAQKILEQGNMIIHMAFE